MNNGRITLGSLFDGSGGFPLGGVLNGITPVWASEIEPFPIRVTRKRFPNMKHLGDVSKINGGEIEPVDIITFGSPCVDLSVAGKREGIHAERSGLFYEAIRIIKEMRESTNGKYPRFAIWENVPGALSSGTPKGDDFRCVLEEFCKIKDETVSIPRPKDGKWLHDGEIVADDFSIAWRILDAQYWGLSYYDRETGALLKTGTPQRRKRIYLVADFADGRAGEILFERKGVCGDSSEGGASWERTSDDAAGGVGRSNCAGFCGKAAASAGSVAFQIETSSTLKAGMAMHCVYVLQGNGIDRADTAGCNGCGWRENECYTLNTIDRPAVCYDTTQITSPQNGCNPKPGDPCHPLAAQQHAPLCVFDCRGNGNGQTVANLTGDHENRVTDYTNVVCVGNGQTNNASMEPVANTLDTMHDQQIIVSKTSRKYIIRRLTPLECSRLQGFTDCWCDGLVNDNPSDEEIQFWKDVFSTYSSVTGSKIKSEKQIRKWLAEEPADSSIYKMWGNGVNLPCVDFVMSGIANVLQEEEGTAEQWAGLNL